MRIMVMTEDGEIIHENIEAEDFLFENYDEDLEYALTGFEYSNVGDEFLYIGTENSFFIRRLEDDSLFDED